MSFSKKMSCDKLKLSFVIGQHEYETKYAQPFDIKGFYRIAPKTYIMKIDFPDIFEHFVMPVDAGERFTEEEMEKWSLPKIK